MIALIEQLVDKYFSTKTFNLILIQMAKAPAYEVIDVNSNNDIKGKTTSLRNLSFRSCLVSLTASSILYYKRIEINNNLPDEETIEPIDSSQLSYTKSKE